jgi:RimJ/RimL family protein N-acetyltransferase
MKLEVPLLGEFIELRMLDINNATSRYLSWLSDPEVIKFLELRFSLPASTKDLAEFILAMNESEDTLMLGIFRSADLMHIGNIKLGPINKHHGTGDLGFLIGERSEWGKGNASAAIELMVNYAFSALGLAKVTAGCYSCNEGSRKALLKGGFVEEGLRSAQYLVEGNRQDGVLLGKINPSLLRRTS